MNRPDLASAQRWFATAITTGECVEHGVARSVHDGTVRAADIVTSGPRLSAIERLGIYHHAYRARLVECLTDDYPALRHALGEALFERLGHEYVALHPSTSFSLNFFGALLPQFCRRRPEPWGEFASELASLEWAIVEVIHAPASGRLDAQALGQIAPEDWSARRLVPSTALRILRSRHPVNEYYQAFRDGVERDAPPPGAETVTAVSRADMTVWRNQIAPPIVPVFDALLEGASLGDALAKAVAAESEIATAFRDWMSTGIFVGVE